MFDTALGPRNHKPLVTSDWNRGSISEQNLPLSVDLSSDLKLKRILSCPALRPKYQLDRLGAGEMRRPANTRVLTAGQPQCLAALSPASRLDRSFPSLRHPQAVACAQV